MTTIDSLDIQISANSDKASQSIDKLCKNMEKLKKQLKDGISNFDVSGFSDGVKAMQEKTKDMAKAVEEPAKKISKSLEEINNRYKDLGKGFQFFGNAQSVQKKIDSLSNALETAKLKKQELEAAGKTEGRAYEDAVKDVNKYTNQIESLKNQLTEVEGKERNIEINVDFGNAECTLEDFKEQLKRFDNTIETGGQETEAGITFPVRGLEISLEQLREMYPEAKDLISSYEAEIERAKSLSANVPAVEYGAIDLSAFEKMPNKAKEVADRLKEFGENLKQLEVPEIREENLDKLRNNLERTEAKLDELRTKLLNGLTMGRVTENVDDTGWRNLQEQIALTEKTAEALKAKISEIGDTNGFGRLKDGVASVSGAFSKSKTALSGFDSAVKKTARSIKNIISKFASLAKNIKIAIGSSREMNTSFADGVKTILKYGFGIRSLYVLFNKLRSAIKDGMENLVQYSGKTNASMSLLSNSLNQFKNASAAAISPLLNAFAPALNQIIQLCIKAANAVNQLISALTGQSTWIKATKLSDNFAKSAGGAASKAKELKAGVRSFDELKTINMSGGDSGGGGGTGTSPSDMFETENVSSKIKNFADMIKEAWSSGDFTEIGAMIGEKLKTALESIPWDSIYATASNFGKSLATFLNGLISPELFADLGTTVAGALNTALHAIDSFGETFDWENLGKSLASGLVSFLQGIDWETALSAAKNWGSGLATALNNFISPETFGTVGDAIGKALNTALEFLKTFGETFDWHNFGESIATGINNFFSTFDAVLAADTLNTWADGILTSLIDAVSGTDWEQIGEKVSEFISNIDYGKLLADAIKLSVSLINAAISFAEGLAEKFDPIAILKSIKDGLATVDWSEAFESLMKFLEKIPGIGKLIEVLDFTGIIDGFTDLIDTIEDFVDNFDFSHWYENAVKPWFTKEKWKELGTNAKDAIVSKIEEMVGSAKKSIENWWKNNVKPMFTKAKWEEIGKNIKSGFNAKWSEFKTWWNQTEVVNWWSKFEGNFDTDDWKSRIGSIKSAFSSKWSVFKTWWEDTAVANWIDDFENKFSTDKIKSMVGSFKSAIKSKWDVFKKWWKGLKLSFPKIKVPHFEITFETKTILGQEFKYPKKFDVKYYASGGFPEAGSFFWAGEKGIPEMLGTVGGKTAVAGGAEITGIKDEIRNTANEEIALLRQQNALLQALLQKDYGITTNDIGKAAQTYSREYMRRTGKPAFSM